jgi:rRNA maturation protein Nop10
MLVLRCACQDVELTPENIGRDICPRCGQRRKVVVPGR